MRRLTLLSLGLLITGCNAIFGITEGSLGSGGGAQGGGAQGGAAPGGGAQGGGAQGGGGGATCMDGDSCYSGDAADLKPGAACREGTLQGCDSSPVCAGEVLPGMEDFVAPGDEDCDGRARGAFGFVVELEGSLGDVRIHGSQEGALFMTGVPFSDTDLNGAGAPELQPIDGAPFLANFNADGVYKWSYVFSDPSGAAGTEEVPILAVPGPSGREYVFIAPKPGTTKLGSLDIPTNSIVLLQFDAGGIPLVAASFPYDAPDGFPPQLHDAVALPNGGFALAGDLPGNVAISLNNGDALDNSKVQSDAFVIVLTPTLTSDFARIYGDSVGDKIQTAERIAVGDDGSIYLAGRFQNFVQAGALGAQGANIQSGGYVLKLDPSHQETWFAYATNAFTPLDLETTTDGVAVYGTHVGPAQLHPGSGVPNPSGGPGPNNISGLVWKLRDTGLHDFNDSFDLPDDPNVVFAGALARTAPTELLFATAVRGTLSVGGQSFASNGADDPIFAKLKADGSPEYLRQLKAPGSFQANVAVARDPSTGRVWITNQNGGSLDFGSGPAQPDNPSGLETLLTQLEP